MLSLFKKKKSKKDKGQRQDDEKENASSPSKVKKSSSGKSEDKKSPSGQAQKRSEPASPKTGTPGSKRSSQPTSPALSNGGGQQSSGEENLADRIKRRSLRECDQHEQQQLLTVMTSMAQAGSSQQPSPLSSKSAATTINIQHPRHPVLSASDAAHSASFVRGNFLSSTISGSDLHRFLNSGYLNGDSYLSRGVEPKTPKSPHFHRPPNFSYSRSGPNYVTHRTSASRAVTASSASSDGRRVNRATMSSSIDRGRSVSPMQQQQTPMASTVENPDESVTAASNTLNTTQSSARNLDSEEPIRLSKFSGGYMPDPQTPRKIESLDWPAPPYPAAVPELRARSRSSSNRRAPSTVTSIRGTTSVNGEQDDEDDEDEDEDEEMMRHRVDVTDPSAAVRQSTGAASVSSSMARAKASRPNSKLNYHNKLFDNDYDDYLLRYRSDKEFRRVLNKSATATSGTRGARYLSGESSTCLEDLNPAEMRDELSSEADNNNNINSTQIDSDDDDGDEDAASKAMTPKLEEISKLENQSSMAYAVLSEIKAHQRIISHKLKIDPWKASRTPNAKAEPTIRTRFESPVNASPSRVFNYPRSQATSGSSSVLLSPTTAQAASTSCFSESSGLMSPPPIPQQSSNHPMSPAKSQPYHYHKPTTTAAQFASSASSIQSASYLQKNINYINSSHRVISTPKAGLNNVVYNMAGS